MQLNQDFIIGCAVAIAVWVFKELWSAVRKNHEKDRQAQESKTAENTAAVTKLTLAVQALEITLGHVTKALEDLPKMKKDLDEAHTKIRTLQGTPRPS